MLSRRRWFAGAAAVVAGVVCSASQAFAGLLGRKRRAAECPCPPVCDASPVIGRKLIEPAIFISHPLPKGATGSTDFTACGTWAGETGVRFSAKCYIEYTQADGKIKRFPPHPTAFELQTDAQGQTFWDATFTGADPTASHADVHAELHVRMYRNNLGNEPHVDADLHLIKIP